MRNAHDIRDTVIRSLSAIGAVKDARFYAEIFSDQDPEKFALIVIDPRCLKNPLLEALIGNLRLLADLGLTPTLLIGALDEDMTSIRFQSQRLAKELDSVKVKIARLNTASYGLYESLKKAAAAGRMTILENTTAQKRQDLQKLVTKLDPAKVIFLQPSGGIAQNGRRVAVINVDDESQTHLEGLTQGQQHFVDLAQFMLKSAGQNKVYVIASPLNLLQELFTVKGSGTLIRQGAKIQTYKSLKTIDLDKLKTSIESGFDKPVQSDIRSWKVNSVILDSDYRGGAILTPRGGITYLSKFWVIKEAQGEGIARDIWDVIMRQHEKFFWRSRMDNPFNDWYLKTCDGMQIRNDWRVFWKGLSPEEITTAINTATDIPPDF